MSTNGHVSELKADGCTGGVLKTRKPVRVWMDGCFDLVHYGHGNALRQAKKMGDVLVVGVHSDRDIVTYKGPPVFTQEERYKMVKAMKCVDEVVEGSPLLLSADMLNEYQCDFSVHGEDPSILADGSDAYQLLKDANRYRECKRTVGISTTDLIERMLLLTKSHHQRDDNKFMDLLHSDVDNDRYTTSAVHTRISQYPPTIKHNTQFSSSPEPTDGGRRIVYVMGAFDLFHVGHLDFLEAARKEGDYLLVGIQQDSVVNQYKGVNFPIMNLHERVLNVLTNRYVSEVVIGAPYTVTAEFLEHFNIDIVCHGSRPIAADIDGGNPYQAAIDRGKLKVIDSGSSVTTMSIVERIIQHRLEYEERNRKKEEMSGSPTGKINESKHIELENGMSDDR